MLFNSFVFALFFPIVLGLYWILPHRWQNRMLLVASYIFYGYWDWRFLTLIALSTVIDYVVGLKIGQEQNRTDAGAARRKKRWLTASVCASLGILGFFKYYNFFSQSMAALLANLGLNPDWFYLDVVLPVGVSFYTFQTMSYVIDVYRGILPPAKRLDDFALYVSYFPQLVAGPIERASALLPRVINKRVFNRAQFLEGLHLIFWGLFKKVYVADNLGPMVDKVFASSSPTGLEVLFAAYGFAVQAYCDFSGYSDIARGCGKCMGIELMLNFNFPYISRNPSEHWRRWHISLSTWLRDYLYIPLGGNRGGTFSTYKNLMLTMVLGGLWHGASWVFVVWGTYQGVLLIGNRMLAPFFERSRSFWNLFPSFIRRIARTGTMFHATCLGYIMFRSQTFSQIGDMLNAVTTWRGLPDWSLAVPLIQFSLPLVIFEILLFAWSPSDPNEHRRIPLLLRGAIYGGLFYLLAMHGAAAESFIYFQF